MEAEAHSPRCAPTQMPMLRVSTDRIANPPAPSFRTAHLCPTILSICNGESTMEKERREGKEEEKERKQEG